MKPEEAVDLIAAAVVTIIEMALVLIVPGLILGIIVAIIQGATSIQEQTLTFLPRMILTLVMVSFFGHWMITKLVNWFDKLAELIPGTFA